MFPVLNYLIINKGFLISSNREDSSIFIEINPENRSLLRNGDGFDSIYNII